MWPIGLLFYCYVTRYLKDSSQQILDAGNLSSDIPQSRVAVESICQVVMCFQAKTKLNFFPERS